MTRALPPGWAKTAAAEAPVVDIGTARLSAENAALREDLERALAELQRAKHDHARQLAEANRKLAAATRRLGRCEDDERYEREDEQLDNAGAMRAGGIW